MTRNVKFRAWDDLNKKWLLGYEYPNLGGFSMMGEVMCFGEYSKMLNSFRLEDWDKIKLMQFTELLDKKGKEIYEGDILAWRGNGNYDNSKLSKVDFYEGAFHVTGVTWLANWYLREYNESYEIIGNIYENPELLNN